MAIRNISVIISANVRKYTDGLRTAASATKKFQQSVSTSGQVAARNGKAVAAAAREHSVYEKALHGVTRGSGVATAGVNRMSAATRNGNRALAAASNETGMWAKSLTFLKTAAVQSVAALGGFMFINAAISGIIKGFGFLVDSVMSFDTAITESMAIAEQYGPGVRKQFEEAARAQSQFTSFSPTELAEGYEALLQAGLDTNTSIEATAVVANFAQAGVMDMGKASDMAAQATASLGLATGNSAEQVANMARVTDVLVVAAIKSTASVEDFGDALTNKFGTALSLANKTVEEGTAILMAYARVGVKGKAAGTQAAIFLRDIQKAAIDNGDAFEKMGIQVYDGNGNLNDLVTIGKQMNSAFGNMDSKSLRIMLKNLGFADRAVHSILPIIATGADTWDEFYSATRDAGGASAKIASRQLESLANRIKLVKNAMQVVAEQAGRKGLDILYKGWKMLEEPVTAIIDDVKEFGPTLIESIRPAMQVLGGSFMAVLRGILETVQAVTSALNFVKPVLAPFMTVGAMLGVVAIAYKVLAGAVGMFTASSVAATEATVANTTANAVNATSIYTSAAAFNAAAAASSKATTQSLAYAAGQQVAALKGAGGAWAVMGSTGRATLDSLKGAAVTAGAKLKAALSGVAPMLAVAAVAALIMKVRQLHEDAKAAGDDISNATRDKYDMSSYEDRLKSINEQAQRINKQVNAYNSRAYDAPGAGWNPQTGYNRSTASDAIQKQIDNLAKDKKEAEKLRDAIQEIAKTSGVTFDVAAKRVQSAGLAETFIEADKGSTKYKQGLEDTANSLTSIPDAAAGAGMSVTQLADLTDEETQGMQDAADDLQKKFAGVLGDLFDPSQMMNNIQEVNDAISSAFGGSFESISSSVKDDMSKAADDAFSSYEKGLDAQVKALEDKKDALDPARGKKLSNKQKDAIDAEKDAIDDQIDSLKEGKKAKEDFESATPIGMDQFLSKMKTSAAESKSLTDNLQRLRDRLRSQPGMTAEMTDTIVKQFAEMGPEAAPLIDEFANATEARFTAMATQVAESIKQLNPEIKVTLQDLIAQQSGAVEQLNRMNSSLLAFNGQMDFNGGLTVDQIKQFAALGPEYAKLIPDMVAQINAGGPAAAQQIADVVRTQLQIADYGTGAIPDAISNAMIKAREAAAALTNGPGGITSAIHQGLDDAHQGLTDATSFLGVDMANKWYQGVLQGLAANGDPFAMSQLNPGKAIVTDKGIYMNGEQMTGASFGKADGGIVQFADGGIKDAPHKPQIAKAGDMRIWAEPETGGEAYIPLGTQKRPQALPVLADVAKRFGYQLTQYANGGFQGAPGAPLVGGGNWGAPAAAQIIPVPVPIATKNETNFNGPIQGVKMEDAEKYAERKRRQSRLAGGRR